MSAATTLPLSALRARLDDDSAGARWLVDPDGVLGRVLELPAGATYTVPLTLATPVSLRARARLYPHDWRDRRGAVRTVVSVWDGAGRRREQWAATLHAGDRGRPGGIALACELPTDTAAIAFELHPLRQPAEDGVARAIWVEPALHLAGPLHPTHARAVALAVAEDPVPGDDSERQIGAHAPQDGHSADRAPLFSVLVPVHDPPLPMLAEAVESVRGQTFGEWELCLADDGSTDPAVVDALERCAREDPRIRLVRHARARGISAATNAALGLARGTYVALLDHDDTLAPDALERVAAVIAADPRLDMAYSDEDIVDSGRQVWVHLKPAWSPDTLRTNGYTCHLGVYRRSLVQEIGGFRSEFDGSQDIDMILRLTERSDRVAHVPGILYHWRAHPASTAGGSAKPYAYVAARNAYAAHLERSGVSGTVGFGPPGLYRLAADVDPASPVQIALAVDRADGLTDAARSWLAQDHATWALTLAAPPAAHAEIAAALAAVGVADERRTLLHADGGDLAAALSRAAAKAAERAEFVLLLQAPATGLTHGWLRRLVGYAQQAGVAAAGPVVLAPNGQVAHGGIALPDGLPLYLLHGSRTSMDEFFGYGTSAHNVSALSGALLTPAATLRRLGGLDPAFGELALVDYCLRAAEAGERIVTVPDARLRLSAGDDASNDLAAIAALARHWSARRTGDPYYNPGYRSDRGDFQRVA